MFSWGIQLERVRGSSDWREGDEANGTSRNLVQGTVLKVRNIET